MRFILPLSLSLALLAGLAYWAHEFRALLFVVFAVGLLPLIHNWMRVVSLGPDLGRLRWPLFLTWAGGVLCGSTLLGLR